MEETKVENNKSKILVIRLSALGDVVLATSVLSALKNKFPEKEIHFLTKEEYLGALVNNPSLDKVILLKKKDRGFFTLLKLARQIGKEYEIVIDLHLNLRSRILNIVSGKRFFKYRKNIIKRRMFVFYSYIRGAIDNVPDLFKDYNDNIIENYFAALKPLGIKYSGDLPWLVPRTLVKAKNIIAMFPGGKHFTKRWLKENFARVMKHFADKGYIVALMGDKRDRPVIDEIMKIADSPNIENWSGSYEIEELIDTISGCKLIICNDSAPAHFAVSLAIPCVAIFCGTSPRFGFAIPSKKSRYLSADIQCKPCSLHGKRSCWLKHFNCARLINYDQVIKAGEELLHSEKDTEADYGD